AYGFVLNQGDGWSFAIETLGRAFEAVVMATTADESPAEDGAAELITVTRPYAERLGQRTADLHNAFARATDDPAFVPEPITPDDLAGWVAGARAQAEAAFAAVIAT